MWVEQLAGLVLEHGMSGFILGADLDDLGPLRTFAEEVAPGVRELVASERR